MGVPVVSRAGDRHASRVGASLLTAVGHPEWLARNWEDYIGTAAALAGDPAARGRLRAGLRGEMRASILLDHPEQARRFGAALRAMWREHCRPGVESGEGKAA
jgi:predicted O-linked N-acetylglucosamine transferase (SPINDLY family)